MIDFSNCATYKKTYGGANGNKLCIAYNGEKYMLKFPSHPTKKTELSYANGCISEYICCHIYNMLGIPAQGTLLGTYTQNGKEKIVVACGDLEKNGYTLKDFASLKNAVIDSKSNGYGTELSDILDTIELQTYTDPIELKRRFWAMFVVDALLGNFDRHNGNWGFLYNAETDDFVLSPVYDCGSCLYPQADKTMITKIMENKGELHSRIFNFPTSAIKQNDKKINYYDFLMSTDNADCLASLMDIYKRTDFNKISLFIENTEGIDDLQKRFYKTMLSSRLEMILEPACARAAKLGQSPSFLNKERYSKEGGEEEEERE